MKKLIFLFIFISNSSFGYFEDYNFKEKCIEITSKHLAEDYKCVASGKTVKNGFFSPAINELALNPLSIGPQNSLLIKELKHLKEGYAQRMDHFGNMTRYLKGKPYPISKKEFYDEFLEETNIAYNKIVEAGRALNLLKANLKRCGTIKCGSSWRIDLEKQIEAMQGIKRILMAENPLLVSDHLEEIIKSNETPKSSVLLLKNLTASFNRDYKTRAKLGSFEQTYKKYYYSSGGEGANQMYHISTVRHQMAIDLTLANTFQNWNKRDDKSKKIACQMALARVHFKSVTKDIKSGGELILLGASILPGALPLTGSLRAIKAYGYMRSIPFFAQLDLSASLLDKVLKKSQDCKIKNDIFLNSSSSTSLKQWQSCTSEESNLKITALLSTLPYSALAEVKSLSSSTKLLHFYGAKPTTLANVPKIGDPSSYSIYNNLNHGGKNFLNFTKKDTNYSVVNLSTLSYKNTYSGNKFADDYWKFTMDIYSKRLKLTKEELNQFMKASRELNKRTKLIVTSKGLPTKNNIEGGVAIIESKGTKELLPLEIETGFRIEHNGKKSIEISRLTSTSKNPTAMKEILGQMALMLKSDKSIGQFYVYTSNAHYRHYKRLNIQGEVLEKLNKRDIIVKFTPEEIFSLAN